MNTVPSLRVRSLNQCPPRPGGDFVLYWMVANRRLSWNFALDRAVEHARAFGRPLVILEALRADYPWASDRHHAFALAGMREHAEALAGSGVSYHPYVEPVPGAGKGLVEALAARAVVVVTDDFPAYFIPRMQAAVAPRVPIRLETVDSNGLLPLGATSGPFSAAYHFRRYLQKNLPTHLLEMPDPAPLEGLPVAPADLLAPVRERWPAAAPDLLVGDVRALARLPIDHEVGAAPLAGGPTAARARLSSFIDEGLARYGEERNHPDAGAASCLSPYLHWGHISVHEIFVDLLERRLETVVYRAKFVPTVFAARQFVNHGHVMVNGKRVNIGSYKLKDGDVVEVRDRAKQMTLVLGAVQSQERDVPEYIDLDAKKLTAKFVRVPALGDVPYPVSMEPHLVVEYYSR